MDAIIGGIMIVAGLGIGLFGLLASLFNPMSAAKYKKRNTLITLVLLPATGLSLVYFGAKRIR